LIAQAAQMQDKNNFIPSQFPIQYLTLKQFLQHR